MRTITAMSRSVRHLRSRAIAGIIACGALGCADKKTNDPEPTPGSPGSAITGSGSSGSGSDGSSAPAAPTADTSEQLRKARALMKDKKWAEAMTELDAARKLAPEDATVLSELGWAAFNADNQERAREATNEAIRLAKEPKLKAASLYNLGRIAEQAGDKVAAKRAYDESIALRPHKGVSQRLALLDGGATAPPAVECAKPVSSIALCDCLLDSTFVGDGREEEEENPAPPPAGRGVCKAESAKLAGMPEIQIWRIGFGPAKDAVTGYALVSERNKTGYALAILATGLGVGRRQESSAKPGPMSVRKAGTHSYLWVENDTDDYDEMVMTEGIETKQRWVTICPLPGDPAAQIQCPVRVPLSRQIVATKHSDDPQALAEFKKEWGTLPPFKKKVELAVTVDPSGTAEVKLKSGKPDQATSAFIKTHKLW